MAGRRRVTGATRERSHPLSRFERILRREMAARDWGAAAFASLEAEGGATGEREEETPASERAAVRRVLAMLERVESVALAATRAAEILGSGKRKEIPIGEAREFVGALQDQAGRAVGDAFAALVASVRRESVSRRKTIAQEAARLGALRPNVSDLRASLAAIAAVSPGRGGAKAKKNAFARALQDAVSAAAFVDLAVGSVEEILARGVGREEKMVGRVPMRKLMSFVARSAFFAQRVATLRIAHASEKD